MISCKKQLQYRDLPRLFCSQVECGVCCLMEVIKESAQHHSKSWYLLRARALQTASEYLSLDSQTLESQLRQSIIQQGQLMLNTCVIDVDPF